MTHPSFSLLSHALIIEYIDNLTKPEGNTETKKKTKQGEEIKHTMAVINANIAKDKAKKETERYKNQEVEVTGITQEMMINEWLSATTKPGQRQR